MRRLEERAGERLPALKEPTAADLAGAKSGDGGGQSRLGDY